MYEAVSLWMLGLIHLVKWPFVLEGLRLEYYRPVFPKRIKIMNQWTLNQALSLGVNLLIERSLLDGQMVLVS